MQTINISDQEINAAATDQPDEGQGLHEFLFRSQNFGCRQEKRVNPSKDSMKLVNPSKFGCGQEKPVNSPKNSDRWLHPQKP
jgi:hypothetical protein